MCSNKVILFWTGVSVGKNCVVYPSYWNKSWVQLCEDIMLLVIAIANLFFCMLNCICYIISNMSFVQNLVLLQPQFWKPGILDEGKLLIIFAELYSLPSFCGCVVRSSSRDWTCHGLEAMHDFLLKIQLRPRSNWASCTWPSLMLTLSACTTFCHRRRLWGNGQPFT